MQRRTLIRAATPAAFRESLVAVACRGDLIARRRRVVIVPTRASAELLRQTIEARVRRDIDSAMVLPDLLTREEWLMHLQAALPGARTWLTRVERELLLGRAARDTAQRRGGPPFHLRPGLVAAMLDFYDALRRRQRSVRRFARTLFDELRVERGTDRGSDGLIAQTCFLGFTFLAYQRAVHACNGLDEHGLRAGLFEAQPDLPMTEVVVAVADPPSDPRGLWPADFDLLGRLRGIASIEVVVTDELHDAGFRERLERELPGLEERPASASDRQDGITRQPLLMRPAAGDEAPLCFLSRDREEELKDVARSIADSAAANGNVLPGSVAIVFQRPLPYLYLGQQVLTAAGLPFHTLDALPLAGEPYAALFDLVLTAARTACTREATIALLRSRLLRFVVDDVELGLAEAAALERVLVDRRATGDASTFVAEVESYHPAHADRHPIDTTGARRAAVAAAGIHAALDAFKSAACAADQVQTISAFLRQHERHPTGTEAWRDRHLRGRAAVLGALDALEAALRRHDNAPRRPDSLTAMLHHVLEAQTFAPHRGGSGVHLVDAVAARFGEFTDVHLVGLIEHEWPERGTRSIFYTSTLLKALSWPQESDRVRAAEATFRDLLRLASTRTWLHAFQLEGDTIVSLSPLLEAARHLPSEPAPERWSGAFLNGAGDEAAAWLALRRQRPPLDDPRYRGTVGPQPPRAYRVSRVDRYVDCPFRYFAESVLELPEEREQSSGLTPLERGTLMHALFERFYREWQATSQGAITAATLPEAMARFSALAHAMLETLPPADRALEETRLLGSIVARGLAERVFEIEIDGGVDVRRRLLEQDVRGVYAFPVQGGLSRRSIEIRGTADRIDVLADGSLRVIDYKLGRMPDLDESVQVAVYAYCAQQMLRQPGHSMPGVHAAMYLAFGDPWSIDGPVMKGRVPAPIAVETMAGRFAAAVGGIESGSFPARPRHPGDCQWCPQAGVCRKEYLVEDDEESAAAPV